MSLKRLGQSKFQTKKGPLRDVLKTFIKGRIWDDGLRRTRDVQIGPLRDIQGTLDWSFLETFSGPVIASLECSLRETSQEKRFSNLFSKQFIITFYYHIFLSLQERASVFLFISLYSAYLYAIFFLI